MFGHRNLLSIFRTFEPLLFLDVETPTKNVTPGGGCLSPVQLATPPIANSIGEIILGHLQGHYRTAIAILTTAVPPPAGSSGGKGLPPFKPAVGSMGRGLAHKPLIHTAVTRYRRINRRRDDKFAKKI